MKRWFYYIAIMLISLLSACSNNPNQDRQLSQTMAVASGNVSTISPSTFSGAQEITANGRSKYIQDNQTTYLSYMTPDGIGFQPLVFENDSGTKFIFQDVMIKDIGDGLTLCRVDNIISVKEEPEVVYEVICEDEVTGKDIYEPKEIMIERETYWGGNLAIIDFNSMEAYLLFDDYSFNLPSEEEFLDDNYIKATENAIYLRLYDYNKYAIYRIDKNNIQTGMMPMINDQILSYPRIELASDSTLVFYAEDIATDKYYYYIRNTDKESPPILYNSYTYAYPYVLEDYIIHRLEIRNGKLNVYDTIFTGEQLISQEPKVYDLNTSNGNSYASLTILDSKETSSGVETIAYAGNTLLKITFSDGELQSIQEVDISDNGTSTKDFSISGNHVYWISNPTTLNQSICYTDFGSTIVSMTIPGKPVATSHINVMDDGSVVYIQYMNGTDIGTYSWNINKEEYPRLLNTYMMDIEQIININDL